MAWADAGLAVALRVGELAGRLGVPGVAGFPGDLPQPENDPQRVRELADEILSRPEYRESKTFFDRIQEAIENFLAELLQGIGLGSSGASSVLAWVVMLGLGAVVAGLAYWLVRSFLDKGWGSGGQGAEGDPVILAVDEHRSPDEWRSEAERHEAEGRWREGILCRYRSLVTRLAELEVIAEAVGRTAGEYVGDVAERLPVADGSFRAVTDLFESSWYGGVDRGPEGRDSFVGLAATVLDMAGRAGSAAAAGAARVPEGTAGA
jgi:hypothetical protein